jgi:acyl-CoA thioester hydrolase
MLKLLREYPIVIDIPVAWGEMDSLQHVNNIVYFRYFESVRMAFFDRIEFWPSINESGIGPILGSTNCRFKIPLTYPDTVSVGARVPKIEADRFLMEYLVVSHRHQRVAAEGEGLIVAYDYREMRKTGLPEEIRERLIRLNQNKD